ncbi:hypothetical protein ACGFZP_31590 [Kitasatospora sp. NPDC048239]|uniref:hypothetical protein n=1 Tax=Kitasatospora sp. NPDC048239 TaxID=3364046 RepID=UPI0037118378
MLQLWLDGAQDVVTTIRPRMDSRQYPLIVEFDFEGLPGGHADRLVWALKDHPGVVSENACHHTRPVQGLQPPPTVDQGNG